MIAEILFFVSTLGLIAAAIFFTEEDWGMWVGCICAVVAISCVFLWMYEEEQKPKEIRTKQPPQIDTIIEIRNSIPDTTYVYIFYKEDEK